MTAIAVLLLLLLCAGRGVVSTAEEEVSNYGPRIDQLLDVFNINRLSDGWQQAVTSGCSDDVTSLLSALGNSTLWAQKSEYRCYGQECVLGWCLALLNRMRGEPQA
jgi:hypothetical protein